MSQPPAAPVRSLSTFQKTSPLRISKSPTTTRKTSSCARITRTSRVTLARSSAPWIYCSMPSVQ
jgi:hypothetical protein